MFVRLRGNEEMKMKDFDDIDEVIELIEKLPEFATAGIAIAAKVRETLDKVPMQEAADEVKALILAFAPFGRLVRDAIRTSVEEDVMFRAELVQKVRAKGISEDGAVQIVLAVSRAMTEAIQNSKVNFESTKSKK